MENLPPSPLKPINPKTPKPITVQTLVVAVVLSLVLGTVGGSLGGLAVSGNLGNWFGKSSSTASANTSSTLSVQEESQTTDVVKRVQPSVVSIIISKDLSKIYSQSGPFNFFFGTQGNPTAPGLQQVGGGSGFILTADGYIMTNKHVVSDTQAEYSVVTNDGKTYTAKLVATDPVNDLAVVKIEAKDLTPVVFGDSSTLTVGQTVIAIGNALGQYQNTVTKGIVSGLARDVTAGDGSSSETLTNVIQTDAAINSGNSGGPLVNLEGQVIGVNTAVSQEGQLIGFAIPGNQAKQVFDSVQKTGKIVRPFLGVRYVEITKAIQAQEKLSVDYGVLIQSGNSANEPAIVSGSPAEKAGLKENDIVLEINGVKLDSTHGLATEIQKYAPGNEISLKVLSGGKEKTIKVTLQEFK